MLNIYTQNRFELLEIELFLTSELCTYAELNYLKKNCLTFNSVYCPVDWGCRIHQLHLCRGISSLNEYPGYDTKQSDCEVPVMLGLWGLWSTPS